MHTNVCGWSFRSQAREQYDAGGMTGGGITDFARITTADKVFNALETARMYAVFACVHTHIYVVFACVHTHMHAVHACVHTHI